MLYSLRGQEPSGRVESHTLKPKSALRRNMFMAKSASQLARLRHEAGTKKSSSLFYGAPEKFALFS